MAGFNGSLPFLTLGFLAGFVPPIGYPLVCSGWAALRAWRIWRRLGTPVSPRALDTVARGASVVVEGSLRREEAPSEGLRSFELRGVPGAGAPVVWTDGGEGPMWVDVGVHRVALTPPYYVAAGSEEHEGNRDFGGARPVNGTFRVVYPGDRVRVRGRIEPDAMSGGTSPEAGYRGPARGYQLFPEVEGARFAGFLPIVATSRPRRTGRRPCVAWLGIGLVTGMVSALCAAGLWLIRSRAPSSPVSCETVLAEMLRGSRFDAAIALPCPAPHLKALAHFGLAQIPQASDAWIAARQGGFAVAPTVSEAEAHVLAAHPTWASVVLAEEARRWSPSTGPGAREALACFAKAFAGPAPQAPEPEGRECRGGVLGHDSRYRALRDLESKPDLQTLGFYVSKDLIYEGLASTCFDCLPLERSVLHRLDRPAAEPLPIASKIDRIAYAHHAADLALFFARMGEGADAGRYLDLFDRIAAARPGGPSPPEPSRYDGPVWPHVVGVAAVAAVILGDDDRAKRYLPEAYGKGIIASHLRLLREPEADPYDHHVMPGDIQLFGVASRGDGAELVEELDKLGVPSPAAFAELLPRIRVHKEAVHAWADARLPALCLTCGLFTLATQAGDRRAIARILGHGELEARLAAIAHQLSGRILESDDIHATFEYERLHDPPGRP